MLAALAAVGGCSDDTVTPQPCSEPCADQSPCTIDRCIDGECVSEPAPAGLDCRDDDRCNGEEACDGAGQCAPGTPVPIADGDSCTLDVCDPATGQVDHAFEAGCVTWRPVSATGAPQARGLHSAVWTGSEMIVWGGRGDGDPAVLGDGAAYDPVADTWRTIASTGAPSARHSHVAVWTGSKMIVWGGYGTSYEGTGGIYDPASDSWAPMSGVGAPSGRVGFAATWTGDRLVVHGGLQNQSVFSDGASYDPVTDAWTALPAGGPSQRFGHTAVALPDASTLVWGGSDLFDWFANGASLAGGAWSAMTSGMITPRLRHGAVWSGSRMIVWGGFDGVDYLSDGALYDPAAGWITTTASAGAPAGRADHVMVWTEVSTFVWGGCGGDLCKTFRGDGALFTPTDLGGGWGALPSAGAPSARRFATGVWTGRDVVIWGGEDKNGAHLASGAIAKLIPD